MRTGHCRLLCHRTGGRNAHEGGPPGAPHSATRAPGTMPQSLISQEQIVLHQNTCFCRGRGYKGWGGGGKCWRGRLRKRRLRRHAPHNGNRVFHFRLTIKPAGWTLVGASLPLESSLKNTLPTLCPGRLPRICSLGQGAGWGRRGRPFWGRRDRKPFFWVRQVLPSPCSLIVSLGSFRVCF